MTAQEAVARSVPDLVSAIEHARTAGRIDAAEMLCREAISLEPENASLRLWLGWIAMDRKAYDQAVEAAGEAALLPGCERVGPTRLLVYASAASGDWRLAEQALLDLSATDESAARAIALETAPAFLAKLSELRRENAYQEAVDSFAHVPMTLGAAAPAVMREIRMTASLCHLALGRAEAAIALFDQEVTPAKDRPLNPRRSKLGLPLLVTSLMPGRLDIQMAAVASWRRLGFEVASLNAYDEVRDLQHEFNGVRFVIADRDARESLGRPLVYVDDMLALLASEPKKIGGLINSDIVFSADAEDVLTRAYCNVDEALLFGHRVDVESLDRPLDGSSKMLLFGYDWFLFQTEQAAHLLGGGMVFGAPWWDLWLPLRAKLLGLDIVNVRQPVALHQNHVIHWNEYDSSVMARALSATLIAEMDRAPPISRCQRRVAALAGTLARMHSNRFTEHQVLDWLASLMRGLVRLEATSFQTDRLALTGPFWDELGQI